MKTRFPDSAETVQEALHYYTNRSIQLLAAGWRWDGTYLDHGWGIEVTLYDSDDVPYKSVYVLQGHVGQGHLTRWFKQNPGVKYVTMDRCSKMRDWLNRHGINYRTAADRCLEWPEYEAVSRFYGDKQATRSQQYLMNHIEEGLYILRQYDASDWVQKAFCLHPLVQRDEDLSLNYTFISDCHPRAILLAMEYRRVANSYLSGHEPKDPSEIDLGPLSDEMRLMLIADKIQNRKDKDLYNPFVTNSERLDSYFKEWFEVLDITEEKYLATVLDIQSRTGRPVHIIHASLSLPVTNDGRVLMLKRRGKGMWCLPGGKMDAGETPDECMARELEEETGLDLYQLLHYPLKHKVFFSTNLSRNMVFRIHPYRIIVPDECVGSVRLSGEHSEYAWLPAPEALSLNLAGTVTRELLESV